MKKIHEAYGKFVNSINYVSIFVLFAMMLITTLDVILRKTGTGLSVKGSYELTEMGMVVMVFLGIASLQIRDGHVKVDMIINTFPNRFKCFYMSFIMVIEVIAGVMLTIGGIKKVMSVIKLGTYTDVLHIPIIIFVVIMTVGLVMYTIALAIDVVSLFINAITFKDEIKS